MLDGLLVLSRKEDERIVIDPSHCKPGELIELIVVSIRGDKARIGVKAPREVAVHRKEVWDLLQRQEGKRDG